MLGKTEEFPIWRWTGNSLFISLAVTALVLVVDSLAAFAYSRLRWKGRDKVFAVLVATMLVPGQVLLIPTYLLIRGLGWFDTYWALIVPIATGGSVFGVFLLRTFFASLPEELFEAARIDGAGVMGQYWRICIPLSYPILGTLAILQIVYVWNDFVWPSVVIQDDNLQVISVGLVRLTNALTNATTGDTSGVYGPLFAGYVLAAAPIFLLFLFASRYYIQGLVSSGLKL